MKISTKPPRIFSSLIYFGFLIQTQEETVVSTVGKRVAASATFLKFIQVSIFCSVFGNNRYFLCKDKFIAYLFGCFDTISMVCLKIFPPATSSIKRELLACIQSITFCKEEKNERKLTKIQLSCIYFAKIINCRKYKNNLINSLSSKLRNIS